MSFILDGIKKAALIQIGAAAYVADGASQVIDQLEKKGKETVHKGKQVYNEELKHNKK